jgi:hypothetical protein
MNKLATITFNTVSSYLIHVLTSCHEHRRGFVLILFQLLSNRTSVFLVFDIAPDGRPSLMIGRIVWYSIDELMETAESLDV